MRSITRNVGSSIPAGRFAMTVTKPKRFTERRVDPIKTPNGRYTKGIWQAETAGLLGQVIAYWPHVEDRMIDILRDLLGGDHNMPARQIFRSILSNAARGKMMTAMLERAPINRNRASFYDDVLTEFAALNSRRNIYLHGLWFTLEEPIPAEGLRTFLCEQTIDQFHHFDAREVTADELRNFFKAMQQLAATIINRRRGPRLAPLDTLPDTLPRPRVRRNKKLHRQEASAAKRARRPQS